MTPHQRILSMIRNSRKTLNVVTTFYVLVGFALATVSAFWGDRLGTFLGFVIISGALAFAVLLRVVLRTGLRISNLTEHVDVIRSRMDTIEHVLHEVSVQPDESPSESPTVTLDLAAIGSGDPSVLATATLDRSRYPRLATTMNLQPSPPQQTADMNHEHDMKNNGSIDQDEVIQSSNVNTKNLLRSWKVAIREGDLSMCRSIYSTMLDLVDPIQLEQLRLPMEKLADRIENELRQQFTERMKQEDYAAMFDIGEQICFQLSGRSVAREFERIKPYLLRRLNQSVDYDDPPLKVAP